MDADGVEAFAGPVQSLGIVAVGLAVGFLAGLFGKGGSAVATPLLVALGLPPMVALAAPLPATVPSTFAAYAVYRRRGLLDREVFRWSLAFGVPATVLGAVLTHWIPGTVLVRVTEVVVAALGARFVLRPGSPAEIVRYPQGRGVRLALVATVVGLSGGALANSGGFLLAPLYLIVLRMPLKKAFASSLAVSGALAVPGTIVHAALGHIDWAVVGIFAAASVPMSHLGARVAIRTDATKLERAYGVVLTLLGVGLLVAGP